MKKLLLIPTMLLAACATTGGGGKGSTAPFQGADTVTKRRTEIGDAARKATDDCMKMKKEEAATFHGATFIVTADAAGKLSIDPVRWSGPEPVKQCLLGEANKMTVTPLPGPSVSSIWSWDGEGDKTPEPTMPADLETKVQSLQTQAQNQVESCEQQNLPPEMPADISINFFVDAQGKTHGPTVMKSTAKDGGFDSCVQGVILKMQFPPADVKVPYPMTLNFHVGRLEKL
jgi:hypothetical protein